MLSALLPCRFPLWLPPALRYNPQTMKNVILLHGVKEDEVKPKPKAQAAGRK